MKRTRFSDKLLIGVLKGAKVGAKAVDLAR